jgi:hypothetical protein
MNAPRPASEPVARTTPTISSTTPTDITRLHPELRTAIAVTSGAARMIRLARRNDIPVNPATYVPVANSPRGPSETGAIGLRAYSPMVLTVKIPRLKNCATAKRLCANIVPTNTRATVSKERTSCCTA